MHAGGGHTRRSPLHPRTITAGGVPVQPDSDHLCPRARARGGIDSRPQPAASADDGVAEEIAALDLARLTDLTEVGTGTVERLELAVDELATAYPGTPPAELNSRVRGYLGYTRRLLDGRMTLAEHRRLLVVAGWLSLLAATTLIDLHRDHAAAAYLRTAAQLARETEYAEIATCQAWRPRPGRC